jgi:diacylglycerol O-acyltransferase
VIAMTEQRMLHSDAFSWYMEKDPVLRSTVVAIARLAGEPDWGQLRSRIDWLTRRVPQLRMRVQSPWLRVGPPRWTVDEHFDLDYHLRRMRAGGCGSWEDVLEFARTAAMADFDRARPLWEFTLLTGLADGASAFISKLHHSLTDGIGGVQLAALVVDGGPSPVDLGELPAEPLGHRLSSLQVTAHSLADDVRGALGTVGQVTSAAPRHVLHAVRHPLDEVHGGLRATVSIGRFVVPAAGDSSVLGRRDIGRRLVTLDVPLGDLRAAAHAAGCHLNDAYLAALADGVERYHDRHGQRLQNLHVTVPVSIRRKRDAIGGNRITLTRISLPGQIADPTQRMRRIATVMRRWRHEPALGHTQEIAFGLNLVPRAYLGGVFKRMDLVASDVPGIPQPVWLAGAKLIGYYPFGPTIGAAFNATLMSYAGTCNVGVNIDTSAVADPDDLIACVHAGFSDVLAVGATPTRSCPAAST